MSTVSQTLLFNWLKSAESVSSWRPGEQECAQEVRRRFLPGQKELLMMTEMEPSYSSYKRYYVLYVTWVGWRRRPCVCECVCVW